MGLFMAQRINAHVEKVITKIMHVDEILPELQNFEVNFGNRRLYHILNTGRQL